jgi:hypothetical protein
MDCDCPACTALAAEYEGDPKLLAFYRKKLLIRGWAGRTSPTEKAYILAHATWARLAAERLAQASNRPYQTRRSEEVVAEPSEGETVALTAPHGTAG